MDWRQLMSNEHFHPIEQKEQKEQKVGEERSFATIADIALKGQKVKSMSEEEYCFEERAAICQYDGGLSREDAEEHAKESIKEKEVHNGSNEYD
ncbi:MAG: hypothetical protein H8D67_21300 [Deltaproteobacteria bacterium]|nr:hypothetical protein [Deltaproteobacteria bacterium]MBL7202824.1 hypothetical protein [Desulfobacteraceae bacterium]